MPRTRLAFVSLALLTALPVAARQSASQARPYFTEPAISPDRSEVAFVSGGDIWTAPAGGGDARLLVSHPNNESQPSYSPDGSTLAFVSDRSGGGDIYLLTLANGDLRRLTYADGNEQLDGWSRDGRWIYFSSSAQEIAGNDVYRVRIDGSMPMPVTADRFTNEFAGAASPDGDTLAFSARGNGPGQWWRNGHSHLDESEIWLLKGISPSLPSPSSRPSPSYSPLVERGAKNYWPMWSADGRNVYYMSDRSGAENIWVKPLSGQARQITTFRAGRVLWPDISYDGRTIVFERNFSVWSLDLESGRASEVAIRRRGASIGPVTEHLTLTTGFSDLALSPDGRKVAFVVRGEIFAASARDGGNAVRVTNTLARETHLEWAPDSRRIVYVSERDNVPHLFLFDFTASSESQLTKDAKGDEAPRFSPDGSMIAFVRDDRSLVVYDVATKQERVLATGHLSANPRALAWSSDNKWVAYLGLSTRSFRNAYLVPAAGGDSRPVTAIPNANTNTLSWSPDGTFLVFNTSQRTEDTEIVRVDLTLRAPKFAEDQFKDLFREEPRPGPGRQNAPPSPGTSSNPSATSTNSATSASSSSKPIEIVFDDIRRRVSNLSLGQNFSAMAISPDGRWLLASGDGNLHAFPLDAPAGGGGRGGGAGGGGAVRQLTTTAGPKTNVHFTSDSREVFYLEGGRINIVGVESRQSRALNVTAELDVDFSQEKMEVFRQAWTYMRDGFYDEKFHGRDWDEVRGVFTPIVAGVRTPDELRRVINLMLGELNASHQGASGGTSPSSQASNNGRFGVTFDRVEYEATGRLRVTSVLPLGPAAISKQIAAGDYIQSVDGTNVTGATNLDQLMMHKVGRRVELKVAGDAAGANARTVALQPISAGAERTLLYRNWIESNRAYVEKISNGTLGYVHIRDMSEGALRQLALDLDADNRAKAGVVIDVRHNNGGFVNVYAIDVLARRGYLTMTPRNLPASPARTSLGQRSLELPTILVTNQHSLSDAEDFTEGYRTLKLGKVVGEPTAGWIIFTSSATLIDGSSIRMPHTRITSNDGKTMELLPRPVDVAVTRPIGETYTGRDSQLETAVKELLRQIGGS